MEDLESIKRLRKIKTTLTEMMIDRDYEVPEEEREILKMDDEQFSNYITTTMKGGSPWVEKLETFGGDASVKFPITERTVLGNIYTKTNNESIKCLVVFIDEPKGTKQVSTNTTKMIKIEAEGVNNRSESFSELIIITDLIFSSDSYSKIKDLKYTSYWIFFDNELLFNKTKHVLVPKHELVPAKRANEFKRKFRNPPHILHTDPIVKYYGWKIGDIIMITRDISLLNAMATEMCTKRIVVRDQTVN
jgi:DNA-directed RNA polymerase subunit H (RpoH/RPB5)